MEQMTGYSFRRAVDEDFDAILTLACEVFGEENDEDAARYERLRFEADRDYLAEDEDSGLAANVASYGARLTVPGGEVSAALVTGVVVRATDRRRGLLRELMRRQLTDLRAGGRDSVAMLWASEGRIYQRFGYGLAVWCARRNIESREVSLVGVPAPPGKLRMLSPELALPEMKKVYERELAACPGWFHRSDSWWRSLVLDIKRRRGDATKARVTLYEQDGQVDGYVSWRFKPSSGPGGCTGEVQVVELVAATLEARTALLRHLLTMDLTRNVVMSYTGLGDPMPHMVDEPRRFQTSVMDGLWLRIIDLPAALTSRRYACAVDVVLDVRDSLLPENSGRWRLLAGPDGVASCQRTDAEPDLECDIRDLGAAYLGGTSLGSLAAAGRVRERRPDVLRTVSGAFTWHLAPSPVEMF